MFSPQHGMDDSSDDTAMPRRVILFQSPARDRTEVGGMAFSGVMRWNCVQSDGLH